MRDTAYFDGLWETVQQEIAEAPIPIGVTREDRTGNSMVLVYARNTPDGRIDTDYRARSYLSLSCGSWDTPEEAQARITGSVVGQELATIRHLSKFVGMTRHREKTPDFSRDKLLAEEYMLERGILPKDVLFQGPFRSQSHLAALIRIPDLALTIKNNYVEIRGSSHGADHRGLFCSFPSGYYPQTPEQVLEELVRLQEKWRSS